MKRQSIDVFAQAQNAERRTAVREGSRAGHDKRKQTLYGDFEDPDRLRAVAAKIKQHTLDHLDQYLAAAEDKLVGNGVQVQFAADAETARHAVSRILRRRGARSVVKTKSMLTEEIDLGEHLAAEGIESVETDLGELIVQLSHDRPSHIVKPILHQNRREVATTFEREGLGPYDDTPEVITARARQLLRKKYLAADAAITGANFISAESGRLVLVTNEGNSRFCLAATRCHIALVGIEKLVPRDRDLGVFLALLARSATGQRLSVYTEFITGPRGRHQPDGPDEMHVIFVDNGRTDVLASDCHEILRCIRCGACMNVCPVYRQSSGHAYRSVYPGPLGAVLSPLLAREKFAELADLPSASSLCGACHEVCPVDIPIEELLVRLRDRAAREGEDKGRAATGQWTAWSRLASSPTAWRAGLRLGGLTAALPPTLAPAPLRTWAANHELPQWRGGAFRHWMERRRKVSQS